MDPSSLHLPSIGLISSSPALCECNCTTFRLKLLLVSCGPVCRTNLVDSLFTRAVEVPWSFGWAQGKWFGRAELWCGQSHTEPRSNHWVWFSIRDHGGTIKAKLVYLLLLEINVPTSFSSAPRLGFDIFFSNYSPLTMFMANYGYFGLTIKWNLLYSH